VREEGKGGKGRERRRRGGNKNGSQERGGNGREGVHLAGQRPSKKAHI